jgi:hypothetical protein
MFKKFLSFAVIAMMMSGLVFSCKDDKKDPEPEPEPEVDGPSQIAKDNLIAYFAFEGDGNDAIGGLTPKNTSTTTVTFPEGRRGKGFSRH